MSDQRFFIHVEGVRQGPFTAEEIDAMREAGEIPAGAHIEPAEADTDDADAPAGPGAQGWGPVFSALGVTPEVRRPGLGPRADMLEMTPFWTVLRAMIWAMIAIDAALIVSNIDAALLFQRDLDGERIPDGRRALTDSHQGWIGLMWTLAYVAAGVTFLRYTFRGMKNARAVAGPEHKLMHPGWAVGWYFVPIAALWMPLKGVLQIWSVSMRAARHDDPGDDMNADTTPSLIGWWWAFWVLTTLVDGVSTNIAIRALMRNEGGELTDQQYLTTLWLDALSSGTYIVASLCALSFLGYVASAQDYVRRSGGR